MADVNIECFLILIYQSSGLLFHCVVYFQWLLFNSKLSAISRNLQWHFACFLLKINKRYWALKYVSFIFKWKITYKFWKWYSFWTGKFSDLSSKIKIATIFWTLVNLGVLLKLFLLTSDILPKNVENKSAI